MCVKKNVCEKYILDIRITVYEVLRNNKLTVNNNHNENQ